MTCKVCNGTGKIPVIGSYTDPCTACEENPFSKQDLFDRLEKCAEKAGYCEDLLVDTMLEEFSQEELDFLGSRSPEERKGFKPKHPLTKRTPAKKNVRGTYSFKGLPKQ